MDVNADGHVTVSPYNFDGSVSDDKFELHYKDYVTKFDVDKRDAYENSSYPKDSPLVDPNWDNFEYKSGVLAAMGLLSRQIGDDKVLVRQKPRKVVFALCNFAPSKLVLAPMTMSVKCVKVGSDEACLESNVGARRLVGTYWC